MDIGVIFPQTELGYDTGAVRAVGQAVSDLGYAHLAAYDHVLGGDTAVLGNLGGPYGIDHPFREPLTMFSYLAGFTDIGFATSILIGPQRQTALLAKQAAEVDLLCGGRFRLGLGIGWNKLEYDALGVPFEERTAIFEEQVVVLRALWT
ncbi:MAG TPA: LLM class flavin-dependent oxidoreductase, partial [Acidimicrobiales bacterium]|nr:LLM class flavin-dependent oxidoreductase [Acidimicrobiales bacterium]